MADTIARPVIKNKFWIVEGGSGEKIATIQAIGEDGGFVYVHNNERTLYPSIKLLSQECNIIFAKIEKPVKVEVNEVYGYPTSSNRIHNQVLDVQRYLPIFTKTSKSKSFFCAGHYIIKFSNTWVRAFCPKLITLNRYAYQGPFKTAERMLEAMKEANGN